MNSTNRVVTDPHLVRSLARMIEESTEVIKVAAKTLRFGLRPFHDGVQYDNVADLIEESTDLLRRLRETLADLNVDMEAEVMPASRVPKPAPDDDLPSTPV